MVCLLRVSVITRALKVVLFNIFMFKSDDSILQSVIPASTWTQVLEINQRGSPLWSTKPVYDIRLCFSASLY